MSEPGARETMVRHGGAWQSLPTALAELTTEECSTLLAGPNATLVLPVGSTEPHGPHLPLGTDVLLGEEAARRSVEALRAIGVAAVVAPAVPYGVTRYAAGFAGAISLSPAVVEQLVRELCFAYRDAGFALVCVVNHHLEPEHVSALTRAVHGSNAARGRIVFANQMAPRWGRTLSDEFKRGDCHAGSYETSLVLAARPELVHDEVRAGLPDLPHSLADTARGGKSTFRELGMDRAYTGAPARATVEEGDALYGKLAVMVVTEVREALGL